MPSLEPDLEDVPNRVSLHTDPNEPGYAKRYRTLLEASGGGFGATSKTEGILAACQHADADRRRIIVPQSELNSHLLQGVIYVISSLF